MSFLTQSVIALHFQLGHSYVPAGMQPAFPSLAVTPEFRQQLIFSEQLRSYTFIYSQDLLYQYPPPPASPPPPISFCRL